VKEAMLPKYEGTTPEYAELAIQLGFVTLFAVAFPLAPVICFINNMSERKTDAQKLLTYSQKPRWRGASGIGSWLAVFEAISLLSVVTNSLILLLTSEGVCDFPFVRCDHEFTLQGGIDLNEKFITVVGFEHFFILTKLVISYLIDDVPKVVKDGQAMDNFISSYDEMSKGEGKSPFPLLQVANEEVEQMTYKRGVQIEAANQAP